MPSNSSSNTVTVPCCCVRHYRKPRGLKQQTLPTASLGPESGYWVAGSSVQGLTRLKSRCQLELGSHLRLRIRFQSHSCVSQNSEACGCKTEVLVFSLAVSRGPLSAPESCLQDLANGTFTTEHLTSSNPAGEPSSSWLQWILTKVT